MNKHVKDSFNHIKSEAASYQNAVQSALLDYRRTMARAEAESRKYKDETSYINTWKAAAKRDAMNAISQAETAFTVAVKAEYATLKDDLHDHLTTRPNAAFLDSLRVYFDFGIRPTRAEIEALMTQNGGNPLGYRALNRTLEKTKSEWRIDSLDTDVYENDLAVLQQLSYGNLMYAPNDCHHEAVEIFDGERRLQMREDGSTYFGGYKWDRIGILMSTGDFTAKVKGIDAMADRWGNSVLPSVKQIDLYEDKIDPDTGEIVETAADQLEADFKATAHAPGIERSKQPEIEAARQKGHEQAKTAAQATKGMKKFVL